MTTAHLGAAAACEQHVQALDVAVDDAYQCVVQVCKRARSLARSLDAVVGRGGGRGPGHRTSCRPPSTPSR